MDYSIDFVLSQVHEGKQHLICFGGRVLRDIELKWHIDYHFFLLSLFFFCTNNDIMFTLFPFILLYQYFRVVFYSNMGSSFSELKKVPVFEA